MPLRLDRLADEVAHALPAVYYPVNRDCSFESAATPEDLRAKLAQAS